MNAAEVVRQSSSKKKAGPLIPDREEHITSEKVRSTSKISILFILPLLFTSALAFKLIILTVFCCDYV